MLNKKEKMIQIFGIFNLINFYRIFIQFVAAQINAVSPFSSPFSTLAPFAISKFKIFLYPKYKIINNQVYVSVLLIHFELFKSPLIADRIKGDSPFLFSKSIVAPFSISNLAMFSFPWINLSFFQTHIYNL